MPLQDARQKAENEIRKWNAEEQTVRPELKTTETTNNVLKTELIAANEWLRIINNC
ncbi:unnamed protein product, partial [Onchocerca ochengi]|uniref:Phage tail protein n=1 Tax=Onchocerca ochengi TaxID=42157 RepID=A0A182F0F9_ONCOC